MLTLLLSALVACLPADSTSTDSTDEGSESDTDTGETAEEEYTDDPADLAEVTDGDCPDFEDGGKVKFTSAGEERSAYVYFPENREEKLPIIFMWHPLGASASMMANWTYAEDLATENNVIVIVPDAHDENVFEWEFVGASNRDLPMYDDLRTCAVQELNGDVRRVSSMGMSAGALWTTYLGIHRGDTLATIMTWSGGTGQVVSYDTPAYAFPALLVSGGESDTYNAGGLLLEFTELTQEFAGQLYGDDHYVGVCEHTKGHDFPPDYMDFLTRWLPVHEFGRASPFSGDGNPADVADICADYVPQISE